METEDLKHAPLSPPAVAPVSSGNAHEPRFATHRQPKRRSKWPLFFALLAAIGIMAFLVLKPGKSNTQTNDGSVASVAVAKVVRSDVYNEVQIPAEFRPYVQSELHALVTGYVSKMNVDFGDKVKQGQVLALLEVPELVAQLHMAEGKLQQAQADYENAHLLYTRIREVLKQHPNLVAQQDIDTAQSKDAATQAAIAAAKAEVERYDTLLNYTKITAPFDGVVTKRYVDPGALVQAGTSSDRSMPLLRISDNYHLRLDFPVSVEYVKQVRVGDPVTVRVDSLAGKTFSGKIVRFQNEVNDETRTMITEIELENPDLEIVPGMYAVALFKFGEHQNALSIPVQAIKNPRTPVVNVVTANHEIEERKVKLGVEMADKYEVLDGLKEGEMVVTSSEARIHAGQKVEPKEMAQPAVE
ncbi:MAG TPA: efflux RND transporter periplasmic adaptor subunit [Chthoniobacter sp.]|jgi:RND family efflux transporter MFP subunit